MLIYTYTLYAQHELAPDLWTLQSSGSILAGTRQSAEDYIRGLASAERRKIKKRVRVSYESKPYNAVIL